MHDENSFVTLTYKDMPLSGSLEPKKLRDFINAFRTQYYRKYNKRIRYFAVGEYGEKTWRPHYHVNLFGSGVLNTLMVEEYWPYGFVKVGDFNATTAAYVAGYVTKKLTAKGDVRLHGRHPEFARQSNRPGLGAHAMSVIADTVLTDAGLDAYQVTGDVPREFRMNGKKWPLGRYLIHYLRKEVGVSEKEKAALKQRFFSQEGEKVLGLLSKSIMDKEALSPSQLVARSRKGKIASIEAREKIQQSKGTLL